jgi:hypothetical protein
MSSAAALSAVLELPVGKAMHIAGLEADGSPTELPELLDSPSTAAEPLPVTGAYPSKSGGAYQATPYAPASCISHNMTPALPVMLESDHGSKEVTSSDNFCFVLASGTRVHIAPGALRRAADRLSSRLLPRPQCLPCAKSRCWK